MKELWLAIRGTYWQPHLVRFPDRTLGEQDVVMRRPVGWIGWEYREATDREREDALWHWAIR